MSEVPSSTAFETIGYMLWMMIEPLEATLQAYDPWIVAGLALILGFVPLSRRLTPFKIVGAGMLGYAAYMFTPLTYQLSPLWPDLFEMDTYIRFGLMLIEATLIIGVIHVMTDVFKGLGGLRRKALTVRIPAQSGLNFKHHVSMPVSRALTQTLSVPIKRA